MIICRDTNDDIHTYFHVGTYMDVNQIEKTCAYSENNFKYWKRIAIVYKEIYTMHSPSQNKHLNYNPIVNSPMQY